MSLESFRTPVRMVSTDLTSVGQVQPMQFVQPVWNRLLMDTQDKATEKIITITNAFQGNSGIREGLRFI